MKDILRELWSGWLQQNLDTLPVLADKCKAGIGALCIQTRWIRFEPWLLWQNWRMAGVVEGDAGIVWMNALDGRPDDPLFQDAEDFRDFISLTLRLGLRSGTFEGINGLHAQWRLL